MQAQFRVARMRAPRTLLSQKRTFATPPTLPPSPPSAVETQRIPVVVVSGATPIVEPSTEPLTTPPQLPPSASGTLPPPPPPPPRRPRRYFRRFFLYTTLGALTFYPLSGWLSTKYEGYREIFVNNVPGGELVAEYADEHNWETIGYGSVSKKAIQGWQKATGDDKTGDISDRAASAARDAESRVKAGARNLEAEAKKAGRAIEGKAESAAQKAKSVFQSAGDKAESAKDTVKEKAANTPSLIDRAAAATQDAADKAKALAHQAAEKVSESAHQASAAVSDATHKASAKVSEATANTPFNYSEGVEGIVRQAEKALGQTEDEIKGAAAKVRAAVKPDDTPAVPAQRGYVDTQRPRELRPETVTPKKPSHEGEVVYPGTLPLGHEPPPGYYVPAPKVKSPEETAKETLPLLAPKVREFAESEPIISQLASTIDSLTSSLSTPTAGSATGILSKAHDDLSALSKRLDDVKKAEKQRLEKTVEEKKKEFEAILKNKDQERASGEQGLKANWDKERQTMVDEWRGSLEKELEHQREGIEQRLREEVVSQGIELQRRWLRSIKSQVETERGGRLAKLDHLTTSLKQLERITLDNSATLDDNVRLHKVWSALRALQAKADNGDVAFDDELRLLKHLAATSPESVVNATLSQLESSGVAQTGIKSFAALTSWFTNSVSPRVQSASLVPRPEEASVVSHVASATFSKLMFAPKAGLVQGDDVGSILARAEWCLGEKDLDGAAREVNMLQGWPKKLAEDWLREARRRLEVQQALEVVGAEATLGSLLLV